MFLYECVHYSQNTHYKICIYTMYPTESSPAALMANIYNMQDLQSVLISADYYANTYKYKSLF